MNIARQQHIYAMDACQCRQTAAMRFEDAYRKMLRRDRRKSILIGISVLAGMGLSIALPLAWIALK